MPSLLELASLDTAAAETSRYAEDRAARLRQFVARRDAEIQWAVEQGRISPRQGQALAQEARSLVGQAAETLGQDAARAVSELRAAKTYDAGAETLSALTDALLGGGAAVAAVPGVNLIGAGAAAAIAAPIVARRTLNPTYERMRGVGRAAETSREGLTREAFLAGLDWLLGSSPTSRTRRAILEAPGPAARVAVAGQARRREQVEARRSPKARAAHVAAETLGTIAALAAPATAVSRIASRALPGAAAAVTRETPAAAVALQAARAGAVTGAGFAGAELAGGATPGEALRAGAVGVPFGGFRPIAARLLPRTLAGRAIETVAETSGMGALTFAETGDLPSAIGAMIGLAPFAAMGLAGGSKKRAETVAPEAKTSGNGLGNQVTAPRGIDAEAWRRIRDASDSVSDLARAVYARRRVPRGTSLVPTGRAEEAGYEPRYFEDPVGVRQEIPAPIRRIAGFIDGAARRVDPRRALTAPALPETRLARALERVPGAADLAGEELGQRVVAWARERPGPSRQVRAAPDEAAVALRAVLALEANGRSPELADALAGAYFDRNGARPATTRRALLAAAERVVEWRGPEVLRESARTLGTVAEQEALTAEQRERGPVVPTDRDLAGVPLEEKSGRFGTETATTVWVGTGRHIVEAVARDAMPDPREPIWYVSVEGEKLLEDVPKAEAVRYARENEWMEVESFGFKRLPAPRLGDTRQPAAEMIPPEARPAPERLDRALALVERYAKPRSELSVNRGRFSRTRVESELSRLLREGRFSPWFDRKVNPGLRMRLANAALAISDSVRPENMVVSRATARLLADPTPRIRRAVTARAAELVDADVEPPVARREVGSLIKTGGKEGPDAGRFTRAGDRTLAQAAKDLLRAIARDVWEVIKPSVRGGEPGFIDFAPKRVADMTDAEADAVTRAMPRTREQWGTFKEAVKRTWGTKGNSGRAMARELAWRLRSESGLSEDRAREIMQEATGKRSFADMTAREVATAASAIREVSRPKDPERAEELLRAVRHIPRAERTARKAMRAEDVAVEHSVDVSFRTAATADRRGVATGEPPSEPKPQDGEVPPDPHGLFAFSHFDYVRSIHNVFRHVEQTLEIASRVVLPAAYRARSLRVEGAKLKRKFRGELDRLRRLTGWGKTEAERRVVSDILEANTGATIDNTLGLPTDHPAVELAGWLKPRLAALRTRFGIAGLIRGYVPRFEDWKAWDMRLLRSVFSRRHGKKFLKDKDASFKHRRVIEVREDTIRDPLVWFELYVDRGMRTLMSPVLRDGLDHLNRVLKTDGKFKTQRHADAYRAMAEWSERVIGIPSTGEIRMANGVLKAWKLAQDLAAIFPGGERLRSVQLDPAAITQTLSTLQLAAYSGALGLRPETIVRNVIGQLPSVYALLGARHVWAGALEYVRGISRESTSIQAWADALRQGATLERETGITSADVTLEAWDPTVRAQPQTMRRLANGVMAGFNASEVAMRTIAFRAGESKFREALEHGRVGRVLPLVKKAASNRIRRILSGDLDISRELESESTGAEILRGMTREQQAAFEFGRSIAEETQFLYSPETAPLISRDPLGRLAFQFLSFPVNYADFWLQVFRRGDLPKSEKAAIAMRMFAGTLALILAADTVASAPTDEDRKRLTRRWLLGREERGLALGRMINDTFAGPVLGTMRSEGLPLGPVPQTGLDGLRLLLRGMQTIPSTAVSLAVGEEPSFEPLGRAAEAVARDIPLFVPGGLAVQQAVEMFR